MRILKDSVAREFQPQRDEVFHFAFETFYHEIHGLAISNDNKLTNSSNNESSSSLILAQICINLIKASMPTGELYDSSIWRLPVVAISKISVLLQTMRYLSSYTKDLSLSQVLSSSLHYHNIIIIIIITSSLSSSFIPA